MKNAIIQFKNMLSFGACLLISRISKEGKGRRALIQAEGGALI